MAASPRALLLVESEPGEPIGQGKAHVFSSSNSIWTATATSDFEGVDVTIDSIGDRDHSPWVLRFRTPRGVPFGPGSYTAAKSPDATKGGLDVMADGSSCIAAVGEFTVHEVIRDPSTQSVTALAVDFEHRCTPYSAPRLTGTLRLNSTVDLPVREVTLLVDQFLPIRFNKPIRWTAAAHPALPVEFRFWRFDASTGWMEVQPYGPNPTYTWTPVYADVGVHSLQVWARRIGSPAVYDAWESTTFSITAGNGVQFLRFRAALPRRPWLPARQSPGPRRLPGESRPCHYQFWRLDPDGWHIVQSYSTSGTYTWTPTAADVGVARHTSVGPQRRRPCLIRGLYRRDVRDQRPKPGRRLQPDDDERTAGARGTADHVARDGERRRAAVAVSILAAGCRRLAPGAGLRAIVYLHVDSRCGRHRTHALQVWVRSFGPSSPTTRGPGAAFSVATATPATLTSLSRFPSSTPPAGMEIQWTAVATGGLSPLQYQFWRFDGGAWTMVRDWGPSNTYTWRTGTRRHRRTRAAGLGSQPDQSTSRLGSPSSSRSTLLTIHH